LLDGIEVIVETHSEIWIVPPDLGMLHVGTQKLQVVLERLEGQWFVVDGGVDAERAGVGTAQTPDHRDDLQKRRLAQSTRYEGPALLQAGEFLWLLLRGDVYALGPVFGAIAQDVLYQFSIGEAKNVVEIALAVLGVAARVRAANRSDRTLGAKVVTEGIGQLRGLREAAQEHQIAIAREFFFEILQTRVTDELDLMSLFLTPDRDDLGHDGGEIGVHDTRIEGSSGALVG